MGRYLELAKLAATCDEAKQTRQIDAPLLEVQPCSRLLGKAALLLPLLNRRVWTPVGEAILVSIDHRHAELAFADESEPAFLPLEEVVVMV